MGTLEINSVRECIEWCLAPIDAAIDAVGDLFVFQDFHKFFAGDGFFVVEVAG